MKKRAKETHKKQRQIHFLSKAETLEQIRTISDFFNIPHFIFFDLKKWRERHAEIIDNVLIKFDGKPLAIRSSAMCEDGSNNSYAGVFTSIINVDSVNKQGLYKAVETVLASYPEQNFDDKVLVQEMVQDIDISGVILTRCVDDGSPYYVLNYDDETGSTDSITSGKGSHKTVLVYRNYKAEYCDSRRIRQMLELAKSVESVCGSIPLDIEFALDKNGLVYLLQVRRISTVAGWHPDAEYRVARVIPYVERFVDDISARRKGLFGKKTVFGNMPDWNPAELIGVVPSPLAASLYRRLISSYAWSEARAQMGYRRFPKTELMVMIGGHAFIDVRASFNSFLPDGIPDEIGEKLIDAWLERLSKNPSLHDKVEFDVALTALFFGFDEHFDQRYNDVLNISEKKVFRNLLCNFTNKALDISEKGSLGKALVEIDNLADHQTTDYLKYETSSATALVAHIQGLLEDCLQYGTIPFSIIARHGFIAETLLKSAISNDVLSKERVADFKSSFHTIMGDLARDTQMVCQGGLDEQVFHHQYGHLRPGTFDIMSPCYKDRTDLFANCLSVEAKQHHERFTLTMGEKEKLNMLLNESGITIVDAEGLLEYAKRAIKGREYAKFIFTRNLSAALESIADWGTFYGLGREDLSYLQLQDIIDTCHRSTRGELTTELMYKVDRARIDQALARVFKLSYLIRGVRDIHVVPVHRSEPNFITQKHIERSCLFLYPTTMNYTTLKDCIVCIENADPGFDWIFTKGIAGLITKYGGANSHMSIRCAELQLPAAIGCGEVLFERLRQARKIELDCSSRMIRAI